MSSPKASKTKSAPAAPKPAKTAVAAKKTAAPAKRVKAKSEQSLLNEDKAHFLKALWEGVKPDPKAEKKEAVEVEILRKIPAPTTPPPSISTPESDEALKLAATIEAKLADGDLDALTPEAVQVLMAALCKLYGANMETGNKYPILNGRTAVTGTDAMIACGALLKAVDLQVFELGMWQSWSGI